MNTTLAAILMFVAVSAQAANMTDVLTDPTSKAVFAGNMKNTQNTQTDQADQSARETEEQFKVRAKKVLQNPPPVTPAPAQKTK